MRRRSESVGHETVGEKARIDESFIEIAIREKFASAFESGREPEPWELNVFRGFVELGPLHTRPTPRIETAAREELLFFAVQAQERRWLPLFGPAGNSNREEIYQVWAEFDELNRFVGFSIDANHELYHNYEAWKRLSLAPDGSVISYKGPRDGVQNTLIQGEIDEENFAGQTSCLKKDLKKAYGVDHMRSSYWLD